MVRIRHPRLRQALKKPKYRDHSNDDVLDEQSDSSESNMEYDATADESLSLNDTILSVDNSLISHEMEELTQDDIKTDRRTRKSRMIDDNDFTPRRTRIRVADSVTEKNDVKQTDVIDYVASVHRARDAFYGSIQQKKISNALLDCKSDVEKRWGISKEIKTPIASWLGKQSIKFAVSSGARPSDIPIFSAKKNKPRGRPRKNPTAEIVADLKEQTDQERKEALMKIKPEAVPSTSNQHGLMGLGSIAIFQSRSFAFENVPSASCNDTYQVADVASELQNKADIQNGDNGRTYSLTKVLHGIGKVKRRKHSSHMLFCGGPISAIRNCPRKTSQGDEVIAISTFADEKMLTLSEDYSYIQFWTFPSDLRLDARLEFLLEIPNASAVLSLCWCPLFVETADEEVLGFLAAGTSAGQILIYCIPRNLDSIKNLKKESQSKKRSADGDLDAPIVATAAPMFVLEHPTVAIPVQDDGSQDIFLKKMPKKKARASEISMEEEDMVTPKIESSEDMCNFPMLCVDWSPFSNGRLIAAVSAAGRILVWDIECKKLNSPLIIHSSEWDSHPLSVAWLNEKNVVVSFRSRGIRIFNVVDEIEIYEDKTPKTCGTMIATCPSILPGLVSYDTILINLHEIQYTCTVYISFKDETCENETLVPLFNNHQVQAIKTGICDRTGVVGSVGVDGKFICSLSGRVPPHDATEEFSFAIAKNILHIISHRHNEDGNNHSEMASTREGESQAELCFSHEDCCSNKWLEIRIGDAAMRDQMTMRRSRNKVPEVCLDRRLESLTSMDFSRFTPGLCVLGGESGLVFIMPCSL